MQVKVVELLGGILPSEDGQELDDSEVAELVARTKEEAQNLAMRPSLQPDDSVGPQEAPASLEEDIDADLTLDAAPPPTQRFCSSRWQKLKR